MRPSLWVILSSNELTLTNTRITMTIGTILSRHYATTTESLVSSGAVSTLEAISFQHNDPFLPNMNLIVKKFMELVKEGKKAEQIDEAKALKEELSSLIFERIGIKTQFFCNSHLAATLPNVYTANQTLVSPEHKKYYQESDPTASGIAAINYLKSKSVLGTVNFQKAKLSGWFSEQVIPVFINFNELMKTADFTSEEITAIIAHELGHDFEGAAQCVRFNTTNHVLSEVAQHISSERTSLDLKYVFYELSKLDETIEREDIERMLNGDKISFGVAAFRVFYGCTRSISGSKTYDKNSYEAMSDSFATRFGYADHLASGLSKLINTPERTFLTALMTGIQTYVLVNTLRQAFLILLRLFGKKLSFNINIGISLFQKLALIAAIVVANRESTRSYLYDDNVDRFMRIRQNLIHSLKDEKINKATMKNILAQIDVADEAAAEAFDVPNPIRIALRAFIGSDMNAFRSVRAQKEMEKLANNELFLAAARLKVAD